MADLATGRVIDRQPKVMGGKVPWQAGSLRFNPGTCNLKAYKWQQLMSTVDEALPVLSRPPDLEGPMVRF